MNTENSIRKMTEEVLDELKSQGYSKNCIQRYAASYRGLLVYTNSHGISKYSEAVGLDYMHDQFGFKLEGFFGNLPRPVSETLHHLLVLWHYQHYSTVEFITRGQKKAFQCPEDYQKEYEAFLAHCSRKKYTTMGLPAILNPVKNFLLFLNKNNVSALDDITQKHISSFLSIYADHSVRYIATIVSSLRNFMKLLYEERYLHRKTWEMLPKIKYGRNAFIPPSWKKSDVLKLLNAVDRGSPVGKRDYAILLLVVRLGLRASDVKTLKLNSLDWNKKKLVIVQTKTRQTLELPILDDIGWALIDYLKNGRPYTKSDAVFVNHKAPYGAFKMSNGMQHILRKYMRFAGLEIPQNEHCGLHSLRSTLARTMLESGAPLPVISKVLGHESVQSTSVYLKINLEALRKCPIDPEEVFLNG